jgi:hypothetical protein
LQSAALFWAAVARHLCESTQDLEPGDQKQTSVEQSKETSFSPSVFWYWHRISERLVQGTSGTQVPLLPFVLQTCQQLLKRNGGEGKQTWRKRYGGGERVRQTWRKRYGGGECQTNVVKHYVRRLATDAWNAKGHQFVTHQLS